MSTILIEGLEDLHMPTRHLGVSPQDVGLLQTMRWTWVCSSRSRYISRPSPGLLSIRAMTEGFLFYPQHLVVAHQALGDAVFKQASIGALYDLLGPFRFTTRVLNHLKWDVRRENLSWAGQPPISEEPLPTLASEVQAMPPDLIPSMPIEAPTDEAHDDEAIKRAMGLSDT